MLIMLTALSLLAPPDEPVELRPVFDAFVQSDHQDDQSAEAQLKLGFNGDAVARSFLTFDTSALEGREVVSAALRLWNHHSWSCQPRSWQVWSAAPADTSTRWPGPAMTALRATSTGTTGYNDDCLDGPIEADLTELVREWAADAPAQGSLGLRAADEADTFGWKRFFSSEDALRAPVLAVTLKP